MSVVGKIKNKLFLLPSSGQCCNFTQKVFDLFLTSSLCTFPRQGAWQRVLGKTWILLYLEIKSQASPAWVGQSRVDTRTGREAAVMMTEPMLFEALPRKRDQDNRSPLLLSLSTIGNMSPSSCSPKPFSLNIQLSSVNDRNAHVRKNNDAWQANTLLLHCAGPRCGSDMNDCSVNPDLNLLNFRCCWWDGDCMINHLLYSFPRGVLTCFGKVSYYRLIG